MRTAAAIAAIAFAALAAAQVNDFDGEFVVAFGFATGVDGQRIDMKGARIPFHAERIEAKPAWPIGIVGIRGKSGGASTGDAVTIYKNDNGEGTYFYSGIPMPSALDDCVLGAGGPGSRWATFTMGLNADIFDPDDDFLMRWIGFRTYVSGRGAGVSAFDNVSFDFGGRFNFYVFNPNIQVPGTFKVTFNVGAYNIISPSATMYFAQQFREWVWPGLPDTPFRDEFSTVFSSGGVNVGTSQDIFWFDNDPAGPDGIYDETESDMFDPGNEANFLLQIEANSNGTTETRLPSSFNHVRGRLESGGLSDLWDSDDFYLVSLPGIVFSTSEAPVQLVVESTATSTTATAMQFIMEAHTSAVLNQRIELFNFTTQQYVQLDSRNSTTTDSTVTAIVNANHSQFIEAGTRKIRAKMSWKQNAPLFSYPWRVYVDQSVWQITRP